MEKTIMADLPAGAELDSSDRLKKLMECNDTAKSSVKELADAGIQKLPKIFIRPPEDLAEELPNGTHMFQQVPVISLEGLENKDRRKEIIDSIRNASETYGFFHLVNHGMPSRVMGEMLKDTQRFFEQDVEVKMKYFDGDGPVTYNPNFKYFSGKNATWRDTLGVMFKGGPDFSPHHLPETCRDIMLEFQEYATSLAHTLFELLSESLGLEPDYLKSIAGGSTFITTVSHYYPKCPEPELTLGTNSHFDTAFLVILLTNGLGCFQVLHQNHWIDVPHVPGSLLINIGYVLEIATNGKYIAQYHRVPATRDEIRMSTAVFFRPTESFTLGPIKEILSEDNPPKYYEKPMKDYLKEIYSTGKKLATIDHIKTQS